MKKTVIGDNYLDKIPVINGIEWYLDENGNVVLGMKNIGIANKIAQKLLNKPKVSYIHLDTAGSFIWQQINGKNDLACIGKKTKEQLGKAAEPLYERLVKYIVMLEEYKFIYLQ